MSLQEAQTAQLIDAGFRIKRLGVVMRPDPAHEEEIEGVLNPGAARGPDGELYLFPRLVGKNNYSRIGIARVIFDAEGTPIGVERLGYALEPEEPYELRTRFGTGGCEDPRVTFVEPIGLYVMTYVAWGPAGPRVALAISENCLDWERLGLVDFQPDLEAHYGVLFNHFDNKDAAFSPVPIVHPDGHLMLGMLHRPLYTSANVPKGVADAAPSIWASGCDLDVVKRDIRHLRIMNHHVRLVQPLHPWEAQRIGVGTPPIRTRLGYMIIYHGVTGEVVDEGGALEHVNYDAGVLIFRREKDRLQRYRSRTPILIPEAEEEKNGAVNNIVFPTGIDKRTEDIYDIYYGMADKYIGVARMWLPDSLHFEEADSDEVAHQKSLKL
jgi:beta-1,2-mannobiose phosphorylase / 1,2-beta-oligomannan phosphorylase